MKNGSGQAEGIILGGYYKAKPIFTAMALQTGGVPHSGSGAIKAKKITGRCVFVHPQGRFVTLEFPVKQGFIRECFRPGEIQ